MTPPAGSGREQEAVRNTKPLDLGRLAEALRGPVLKPGEEAYETSRRLWNGMIDHRPAAIVRCLGTADVVAALRFAREHELPVSVRGGGHNVAGRSVRDGALTLDLSAMRGIDVDPEARLARVQPGATWGELDHETQTFGLATTGGADSRTGVAGLTLGGGFGWLARRLGLAADNLEEAELVLADGTWLRADAERHPDLLWALRGGGGSVGVVTSFTYRLHRIGPEVTTAQAFHRASDAAEALRFYRAFVADAPDTLTCYAMFLRVPPVAPFPEETHGTSALGLIACHTGEPAQARRDLEALCTFGEPILTDLRPVPYPAWQRSFDAGAPDGQRYYYKNHLLRELPDAVVEAIVAHGNDLPGAFTIIGIESLGGAIARVAPTATAFPHREAAFSLGIWGGWSDPADDDGVIAWARSLHAAARPHAMGAYANYLGGDETGAGDAAFGANGDRLRAIETRYDPDGTFRAGPAGRARPPSSGRADP